MPDLPPRGDGDEAEPSSPSPSRLSVAATRRPTSNKSTLILGAISIVGIIAVIVVGFMMNLRATAVPEDGYGPSRLSVATVDDTGVITVQVPTASGSTAPSGPSTDHAAPLTLDMYLDALDPDCTTFEGQYGQQIAKAIDDGALVVRYHLLDYLNHGSPSGDYSTRAYAALLEVARSDGNQPGVVSHLIRLLWNEENQPGTVPDGATSDPDNAALAALAGTAGASEQAQRSIEAGTGIDVAHTEAKHALDGLTAAWDAVGGPPQTPSVVVDGSLVSVKDVDWLSTLLGD